MALVPEDSGERKRVKVYELRNNDWFDRGTGFCNGRVQGDDSKIVVESEDEPNRILLDTRIGKDDGYQKQQDTLIVWTESSGVDMALSFQEAEGCAAIWNFVNAVQQHLLSLAGPDDALSDGDMADGFAQNQLVLPPPEMSNLEEIEGIMRGVASTQQGRDALAKFLINEEYVRKLIPLVEMAEDLESLKDLHYLCNIMKMIILLNDSSIIDHIVHEDVVMAVVGALEYDPEFPRHKANHRRYLQNHSRYKEVISISDENVTRKIHATWRLTYLKDVVLARILDDPTFGVLNSLIFFNQVDIITHLQNSPQYLEELFGIIDSPESSPKKKKDAVGFIQSCCAIAKSLQAPGRAQLYNNFINYGLLRVITFAIMNEEASIRVAGTDILVAMIDHDPSMVRAYILRSINENKTPLTETLIELLLVEVDLGVKAQAADAIKVLLEPQQIPPPQAQAHAQGQAQNGEFISKMRGQPQANPATENFIAHFYEHSANKLFKPLRDLEKRKNLSDLSFHEVQLFNHLVEIIIYLSRTHQMRSKFYIFAEGLSQRISQLLSAPQKHLRLTALKFFRQCIGLQDDHYNRQLIHNKQFGPILNIVYETMPRDNLLNSACLELFEYIKSQSLNPLIRHLAEEYGEQLSEITYVDTFKGLLTRYNQLIHPEADMTLFGSDGGVTTPSSNHPPATTIANSNQRWQGMKEMDADEEAYFNTSDDEDELAVDDSKDNSPTSKRSRIHGSNSSQITNGVVSSPMLKSLVDYPDDEDDLIMDSAPPMPLSQRQPANVAQQPVAAANVLRSSPSSSPNKSESSPTTRPKLAPSPLPNETTSSPSPRPPERLSEKRRREEDNDEDELGKLSAKSASNKRRNSGPPAASPSLTANISSGHSAASMAHSSALRRKKAFLGKDSQSPSSSTSSSTALSSVKKQAQPSQQQQASVSSKTAKLRNSSSSSTSSSGSSSGPGMKIEINLGGAGKGLDHDGSPSALPSSGAAAAAVAAGAHSASPNDDTEELAVSSAGASGDDVADDVGTLKKEDDCRPASTGKTEDEEEESEVVTSAPTTTSEAKRKDHGARGGGASTVEGLPAEDIADADGDEDDDGVPATGEIS